MNPPIVSEYIRESLRLAESAAAALINSEKRRERIAERLKSFGLSDDQISSVMEIVAY
jgi:Arc/MetJ-type ribon-helix-helix transcriptional regulator